MLTALAAYLKDDCGERPWTAVQRSQYYEAETNFAHVIDRTAML